MKNRKQRRSKKLYIILAVLILLVVASLLIWKHYHKTTHTPFATKSYPAENDLNNSRKTSSSPAQTLDNGYSAKAGSPDSNTASATSGTVTITRVQVNNSDLQVGTLLGNITTGTCTLSVSQTGETTITATNQVTLQNNSYVCPVFMIPTSQFPNQGNWNVSVGVNNNGTISTGSFSSNPVNLTTLASQQ
jgi:cytoskeletal protein RodZ